MVIGLYLCGFNLDNRIVGLIENKSLPIICCPVENNVINEKKNVRPDQWVVQQDNKSTTPSSRNISKVEITISKIVWNEGAFWRNSGFLTAIDDYESIVLTAHKVKISERRIAVINSEGYVFVNKSNGKGWHQILLQAQLATEQCHNMAVDVVVEDNCILILDKYGTLYSSGIEVSLPGVKISKMAVGSEHCLALSKNGVVYSWGSGMRGQLGNGSICQIDTPEIVDNLQGVFITDVKCGGWHSSALSNSGDVYMWGWNDVGQLGFPSKSLRSESVKWHLTSSYNKCCCPHDKMTDDRKFLTAVRRDYITKSTLNCDCQSECINVQPSPKLLDYWKLDIAVKEIACGARHSVFLLENNSAWTVGWNKYGQLGIGCTESKDEPQLLSLYPVSNVFAGGWNTALIQEII